MAPTEEKYKMLKRKLKEVLEDNDRLNTKLKKSKVKLGFLRREKDLLLDRLTKYEMPDSSEDDSDSLSSSGSDSDASSVSSDERSRYSRTPAQYQAPRSLHPNHWQGYSAYGSGTSTPVSGADLKAPTSKRSTGKKPVTKRAPVVTKTRKIQQVPMNDNGVPILPVQIGIITVHALGQIVTDRDNFHNERYIYPVGYTSSRMYQSITDPNGQTSYRCSVSDGGDGPRFHVVPEDAPDRGVEAQSATGAWTAIIKAANLIRNRDHSNSASGPDYFGFSHPTIAACIQALPGARDCKNYVWQNFEVIKGRGTKRVNRNLDDKPAESTPPPASKETNGVNGGTSSTGSPNDKLEVPTEVVGDGASSDMQVDRWENGSAVDEGGSVAGSRYTSPLEEMEDAEGRNGVGSGSEMGDDA
ncbi:hypothetical protein HK097_011278 [Rhizophlyctis rosea]|uniref:Uncharacterized protein n=1 Tax=Rhizophlyctis rosea TaxID=64517 RepID=A0AAD5S809_9FUNG|nr:hypothetical protein HK097_011278 [Rhizophlyctis rosea]